MNKTLAILISIILLLAISYPLSKTRVIVIENQSASQTYVYNTVEDKKESRRINAIFLGIPGEGNNAPELTDTLMIMSADDKTGEGFLLSIPRDLLVKIPNTNLYTKINNLYQENGIDSVQTALKEITGLDFDYNIVVDLQGVEKAIDQLGGIDIFVEEKIYDPAFPGPNNSYQLFTLEQGWHHLDGETALKYIRTRHSPGADFARMARQQKILIALKEKISSLSPLWDSATILELWKTLTGHFKTNLSLENIKPFWQTAKYLDLEKIEFKVLDPSTGLLVSDYTTLGNQKAYILKPAKGLFDYSEIQKYISNLIQL